MNTYNVTELKPGTFFTEELILDKKFLLLSSSNSVTQELVNALRDWEFTEAFSEGTVSESPNKAENTAQPETSGESPAGNVPETSTSTEGKTDKEKIEIIEEVYGKYLDFVEQIFIKYATTKQLDKHELSKTSKNLVNFIKDNKKHFLLAQAQVVRKSKVDSKKYLVGHTLRTTVFAILIGIQMELTDEKLVELGVSGLLHEIGMIRIPPQYYLTDRKLSISEKNEINTHPVHSYNILKDANFSLAASLGALEHHERCNGKGYPRNISGAKISQFGKILSLACTYEAITGPRQYKDEKSTFEAMIEILSNNDLQFDANVIKSLLLSVSFYPIGSYVYLSNNKVAQVVDASPDNPRYPIVKMVTEKDQNGNFEEIQTEEGGISISKVLSSKESDELEALLQKKTGQS